MIVTNSPAQQIDTIAWQYIAGADPGFFLGGGGGVHSYIALLQHQ